MRVAVQGCSHGCLSAIYDSVAQYQRAKDKTVDLLLLCGDFQALRSLHDFGSLAVPQKYQALGTFHEYYSGKRKAPLLTIVIGGNHEASNYMWELYHGGWLAPNIYYLGAAGSVMVNGLRIVGASGIYKDHDYHKGHFETVPYSYSSIRSVYHIRQYDVERLKLLPRQDNTIVLSHDWPTTIPNHGNTAALLRRKPFFAQEVKTNTLGSPPLLQLMKHIQPEYWFSAHLHVKFAALYEHSKGTAAPHAPRTLVESKVNGGNPDEIDIDDEDIVYQPPAPVANPDEIAIDDDFDDPVEEIVQALKVDESADLVEAARKEGVPAADGVVGTTQPVSDIAPESPKETERLTKFLALDKCGPGKDFIQFLEISAPEQGPVKLTFDPHWLAVTRALHPYLSLNMRQQILPSDEDLAKSVAAEYERIQTEGLLVPKEEKLVWEKGPIEIERVQKFWPTAPAQGEPGGSKEAWYTNPQTESFCGMLGIPNKINPAPSPE